MIYKIDKIETVRPYKLLLTFSNAEKRIYDMNEDIKTLPHYDDLKKIDGLFEQVQVDRSKTIVYWNEYIDLPSDILYEYSTKV